MKKKPELIIGPPSPTTMKVISILAILFHWIGLGFIAPEAFNHYNPYMAIFMYIQYAIMSIFFIVYSITLFSDYDLNNLRTDETEEKEEKEQKILRRINTAFYLKEVCILDAGILLGTIIFMLVTKFINI
jgi:hypothetical protein